MFTHKRCQTTSQSTQQGTPTITDVPPQVGYCQGLSFVAGVLLLHMGEEDAFYMLKFLMYDMGLRKQYRPDMIILQVPHTHTLTKALCTV